MASGYFDTSAVLLDALQWYAWSLVGLAVVALFLELTRR